MSLKSGVFFRRTTERFRGRSRKILSQFRDLEGVESDPSAAEAEFKDRAASEDDAEADPGRGGNLLGEQEPAGEHAHEREDADVDAEESREVEIEQVDDHAVAAEDEKSEHDERRAARAQAATNERVATHLENGGDDHHD